MRFDASTREAGLVRELLRGLLALRAAHPALVRGATRCLLYQDGLLAVLRALPDEAFVLVVNSARTAREFALPGELGVGRVLDALDGQARPVPLRLAPGAAMLVRLEPAAPGGFAGLTSTPAGREIDIRVRGSGLGEGERLLVVGSPPELGGWRPAEGLGPLAARGGALEGRVTMPAGQVYAYKLVVRGEDGRERWQEGENRFLFVPPGDGPLRVEIDFQQG
jgi:hypothetical protein